MDLISDRRRTIGKIDKLVPLRDGRNTREVRCVTIKTVLYLLM